VLRGPQGTLFGKNTTAGALNITSKAPSFVTGVTAEVSGGEHGYYQAKGFLSEALVDDVRGRGASSAATTGRGVRTRQRDHRWHGQQRAQPEFRGQLPLTPADAFRLRLIGDYSSF
jgi:iron complex outermembrane receptor protein